MKIRQMSVLMARIALFIIYFWFGLLKVIGLSPASAMVQELFGKTLALMPFSALLTPALFVILFGTFEILIGLLFIIPGKEKLAVILFFLHMITTTLPLFFLGASVWSGMFVPTLEGQYIIKNLALIACVLSVWSVLPPKSQSPI